MGSEAAGKHVQLGSFCYRCLSLLQYQCTLGIHGLHIQELTSSHIMCQWSSRCGAQPKGGRCRLLPGIEHHTSALWWLVQVKKTLRMYIDNYDYHHTTIAKGDDVTGSSMFHFWLHQVPNCTLC